jgi:glycosyltransferase involved in cell wall biosynthesis
MIISRNLNSTPLVSVIVPAYNAERTISKTLHSVVTQSYTNIEIIVVDDGSEDNTASVVRSFSRRDSRIQLFQQPNLGVARARNLGIENSSGELIATIDADDIWFQQFIEKLVFCMKEAGPSVGLAYTWSLDIDEEDRFTGEFRASRIEGEVYATLLTHNFIGNASASLIRRECIEKAGNYDSGFMQANAQGCEDWDLYLLIARYYLVRVVPEFLVGYRRAKASMSTQYNKMARSHNYMLNRIRSQNNNIPNLLYRLSRLNLYLYFAYDCCALGQKDEIRYWIKRAFTINVLFTLLNYRIYCTLYYLLKNILFSRKLRKNYFSIEPNIHDNNSKNLYNISQIPTYYANKLTVKLKCRLTSFYHFYISIFFPVRR